MKPAFSVLLGILIILSSASFFNVKADEVPSISVKLRNYVGNQTQLTVTIKGKHVIPDSNYSLVEGKTYTVKVENNALSLYEDNTLISSFPSFSVVPDQYGTSSYILINNRPYLGSMQFTMENSTYVRPINTLPLEDYLKGVVPFEMMGSWNKQALKAQAVTARTYAERNNSVNMDDTVSYQAYGGYTWNTNCTAAVDETKYQTLTYNGKTIDAFYSASNGGMTESNANVWGGTPLSIYTVKPDPYDKKISWGFTLNKTQINTDSLDLSNPQNWWNSVNETDSAIISNIKSWMYNNGYTDDEIKMISVPVLSFSDEKTSGNRVKYGNITVHFFLKDKKTGKYVMDDHNVIKTNTLNFTNVSASRIRAMIGINIIKSYLISSFDDNGNSYTVNGLGNGHGVGMSQWGAKVMADQGLSYQDILNFYFPGTTLANLSAAAIAPIPTGESAGTTPVLPITTGTVPSGNRPIISNVSSGYSEKNHQLTLDYTVNQAVTTNIYLKNASGKVLFYLLSNSRQAADKQHTVYNTSKLPNGVYTFGISTTNSDHITASALQTVTINKAVPKPAVNAISDQDTAITGTAAPNLLVKIKVGNKEINHGKADSHGKYKLTISKQKAGTQLSITAMDVIGNTSNSYNIKVVDKTAPAAPKVYAVSNRDTSLTGLTEANAIVIINSGSKIIGTGKADAKGKFKITIPRQKVRTVLTASAKDLANNVSKAVSFKVIAR